uniref:Gamma-glutamyltranspeptidase 1-like n=1 Tax=Saccoglossus kowalevskii TaxID=10224 RepID=A0ABM0M6V1_SACKO|nr:PREDICTED: gamma-glutamyltranspeptidase 1-like [Saccoglossus kowalevskii]
MLGIFVGAVIAGIFIGIAFRPEEEPEVIDELTNYEIYENAAIATDAANCSFIGNEMLKQNGSAVDAAIAALLCVGLHNCHSTGIGGGNFMVIHMKRWGVTEVIDARETAPLNSTYDMFSNHPDEDASTTGGLAIAVPGELHGMWTAHQRWGLIPWDKLFEPTIELAANGFVVGAPLAKAIRQYNDTILADEGLSEYFVGDDGEILKEGDICVMKKLAATLQLIADRGAMEFYSGVTAEAVVADIQERGGIITSQDLLNYEAKKKAPLELRMGDSIMYTPSPPASGAVLSFILNILEENWTSY